MHDEARRARLVDMAPGVAMGHGVILVQCQEGTNDRH